MPGWSKQKRRIMERGFYAFLARTWVNSKEYGRICLGERLYDGQKQFIRAVFNALEADKHKVFVLKSRQLGLCYDPSMRVLTAALQWVFVGDLKIGDEVVAVDEDTEKRGAGRKMRTARVEALKEVYERAFAVKMANGVTLIATAQHRHLCKVRGGPHTEWRSVKNLRVGDQIRQITDPWREPDYEDGWLGGFIDGEGSISLPSRSGACLGISQVPGASLDRAREYLLRKGYTVREEIDLRKPGQSSKLGSKPVHKLLTTRMSDLFRLIGQTRPSRFIGNRWWEGKELPGKRSGYGWSEVVSVSLLDERRMIDVQTSEKTFICEGFVSHNSTISRALSAFYIGMHDGMQGALVFDTMPHRDSARIELAKLIKNLDPSLKFPRVLGVGGAGNRDSLQLENDARILFLSAGTQQRSTSGTLGRSEGLTMAHLSELCSYDNPEGLKAFEQSMSEFHPDRLYIYESTARGYNQWKDMWDDACADTAHCETLFLGWWSREDQRIDASDPDFELYGQEPPSQRERERIEEVRKLYGVDITPEQLAWIRRKIDPASRPDGDTDAGFETIDNVMLAEQAWTAEEAFQQTGSKFFGAKALTEITRKNVSNKFKAYMYWAAEEFPPRIFHAENLKMTELKVWEDPDPDGVYVLACDPAYGENEENDHSAIQVCRCYADGLDQVAEYSWPLVTTYQLAWVIASLLGWYGQARAEIRYILELNGPGTAVFNELKNLRGKIDATRHVAGDDEKGLADIFRNVRTYIYNRPDSMGAGFNYHWVTNINRKVMVMERLRDFVGNGKLRIKSLSTITEMKSIGRDGDSIAAPRGMRDDRTFAMALAVHYWETKIAISMVAQRRTREAEAARRRLSIVDQVALFNQNRLDMFFNAKRQTRNTLQQQLLRQQWRTQGRRY